MNRQIRNEWRKHMNPEFEKTQARGRTWLGIILVSVGGALLARKLGVMIPLWIFSWPMILVMAGIYNLGKHGFKHPAGIILISIGGLFLVDHISPTPIANIGWYVFIIAAGIVLIFTSRRKRKTEDTEFFTQATVSSADQSDYANAECLFGGIEKTITTRDLKGGKISCVFGGAEINLLQADLNHPATVEISAVFGGVELMIPASWKVRNEISAVLGGVEDKRPMADLNNETEKVLILKGSVIFGGVSIKGY